jgi:hypothetical protein
MNRTVITGVLCVTALGGLADAQSLSPLSTRPIVGSSGFAAPPPREPVLSGSLNQGPGQHLGPLGKPCLSAYATGRAQKINPRIVEHVVTANNSCSQSIKLRLCYYKSDRCVPLTVPGHQHKEIVLGIMPGTADFRYQYSEEFP